MKKLQNRALTVFVIITLSFAAFVVGYYSGQSGLNAELDVYMEYGLPQVGAGQGNTADALPPQSFSTTVPPSASDVKVGLPDNVNSAVSNGADGNGSMAVNINTATSEQLQELSGIGPAVAERIIAYRDENGAFEYKFELMDIKGIGQVVYEKLEAFVTLDGETVIPTQKPKPSVSVSSAPTSTVKPVLTPKPKSSTEVKSGSSTDNLPGEADDDLVININTATAEELQTLKGIGAELAARIIELRDERGGFKSIYDLKDVKGIGDVVFSKFEHRLTVGGEMSE
jgi:comEA protein